MTRYRWNAAKNVWEFHEAAWGGWMILRVTPSNSSPSMTFMEGLQYLADPARSSEVSVEGADWASMVEGTSLTFATFSARNLARCESPKGFNHKLSSWSLSDWFTAVMGELGEAANIAKKLNRIRDGIPGNKHSEAELREMLRRELADVYIYLDLTAQAAGLQLGQIIPDVFDRKSREIGYEEAASA